MEEPAAKPGPAARKAILALLACCAALLAAAVVWPKIDLIVSRSFYVPGKGFPFDYNPAFQAIHWIATYGAWILAALLLLMTAITAVMRRPFLNLAAKSWLFLFLALLIGPGLVANLILKDHWGRARPAQVTEFGGAQNFSPALSPQPNAHKNGSFVAGDASFGFFLPCIAFVVPCRRSRKAFWVGIGVGSLFGLARIMMGAHFLSDVLFAALVVLATATGLHAAMYGHAETRRYWRKWLFIDEG